MHDARDAEDKRLLDEGEHALLLAAYFDPVRERCYLRLRDEDAASEAAQRVFKWQDLHRPVSGGGLDGHRMDAERLLPGGEAGLDPAGGVASRSP